MENVIFILALLLIGKGLSRLAVFPANTFQTLANFVIYVSLPALILYETPRLEISTSVLTPIVMPWAMLLVSAVMVLLLSRAFRWRRATVGAMMLLVPLGNTSFLGIPMVETLLGKECVAYALLYDQFGSFLALTIYGSMVVAVYAGKERPTAGRVIKSIITFPPFIAMLAALLFRVWPYPASIGPLLKSVGATLVPIVMVAVGFKLQLRLPRQVHAPLGIGLVLKLVITPVLALAFCRLTGLHGPAVATSILEAGMPPMITAGAIAIAEDLDSELSAAMLGYGIVVSFATLGLLVQVL